MKNESSTIAYMAFARIPTEKAHGVQIVQTCQALARAGMQVDLFVPYRKNEITETISSYYGIDQAFSVKTVYVPDLVFLGKIGYALSLIMFSARAYISVMWGRYNAVYSRDILPLLPFVVGGKRTYYESHKNEWGLVKSFLFRKVRGLICITEGLQKFYTEKGIEKKRIHVVPDAVDMTMYDGLPTKEDCRKQLGLPTDKRIAMYVGSFFRYAWKGADVFLDAAQELPHYIFVGVGVNQKEKHDLENKGLARNVILIEKQPSSHIAMYMKSADVLVLPNKKGDVVSEKYTSPMKMFEYMASGNPIVSSKLESILEVLSDKEAVLVPPNDPKELARGITKAFNESSEYSKNAYEIAKEYTWDKRAQKIIDIVCAE